MQGLDHTVLGCHSGVCKPLLCTLHHRHHHLQRELHPSFIPQMTHPCHFPVTACVGMLAGCDRPMPCWCLKLNRLCSPHSSLPRPLSQTPCQHCLPLHLPQHQPLPLRRQLSRRCAARPRHSNTRKKAVHEQNRLRDLPIPAQVTDVHVSAHHATHVSFPFGLPC